MARRAGKRRWDGGSAGAAGERRRQAVALQSRISELERLVGRQAAELDFFAAALRNIEESRPTSGVDSGNESTPRSKPARKAR